MKENRKKITIKSSVFIPVPHDKIDIVFDHVFNTKKFYKWFNLFPVLWISFNKKQMRVGCVGTIFFTMPFYYYKLKVVKVIPNKSIIFRSAGGFMKGRAYYNFIKKKGGITLQNIHELSGNSKLLHYLYVYALVPNHLPFMNWRYSILKRRILKEIKMSMFNSKVKI